MQDSTVAGSCRRNGVLHTALTLDDLHSELTKFSFKLSHLAVYLQLMLEKGDSHKGTNSACRNLLSKKNNDKLIGKLFIDNICVLCEIFGLGPILLFQTMMKLG